MFTYDPGFTSTASCQSAITYIDGDKGILLHRGYPIDQLAEQFDLHGGRLPAAARRAAEARRSWTSSPTRSAATRCCTSSWRPSTAVSAATRIRWRSCAAWSARSRPSITTAPTSPIPQQRMIASHRLIAKMPTIAAMAYKYSIGQPFLYPENDLSYTGNFLRMTFGVPAEPYEVNPIDRDGRCAASSSSMPTTSRTRRPRPFAWPARRAPIRSPASRPASPACGARRMAAPTKPRSTCCARSATPNASREYIARAKDKDDPFRLMGFGHRVYKNFDPRAKVMKATADEVLKELNITDPVLDVAKELEHIALNDDYFIEKKLYPNVDFYSGVILNAIGFPTDMFTALVRACPHGRLGRAVERDDRRSRAEDRPPAPALRRRDAARLCSRRQALGRRQRQREARAFAGRAFQRHVAAHRARKPARNGEAEASARRPFRWTRSKRSKMRCWSRLQSRCPRRRQSPTPSRAVRANVSRTVPPSGEWRMALPIRLTRIWMTAALLARRRKLVGAFALRS